MRAIPILALGLSLAITSSAPAQRADLADPLRQARAEQASAEARAAKLQSAAEAAQDKAQRLRLQQVAAAEAMEAAEARITAAGLQLQRLSAAAAAQRQTLAEQQRPLSGLLGGLGIMGQRPPLLALTDRSSADEFVRVRILLDATMPAIRSRTAAVSQQLRRLERLQVQAAAAKAELSAGRRNLAAQRQQFASLERQALERAAAAGGQALSAGDVGMAAAEQVEQLEAERARISGSARLVSALAADGLPASPLRPGRQSFGPPSYRLPIAGQVTDGLGSVSANGVRSRGITIAAARGAQLVSPAAGVVRFAGPFRDYDGVIIIDHGGGWTSLIVNAGPSVTVGAKVGAGQPIGRALGAIQVELSRNGQRWSPAIIAGSSQTLSNEGEGG